MVLTALELRSGARGGDWLVNLQAWAVNLAAGPVIFHFVHIWRGPALIDVASLPFWLGIPLFIVVQDLGEYLFHRAQHRIPFLWSMHSLHHSDPAMSALTTNRHFWGDRLIKTVTIWSAAAILISTTPEAVLVYFVVGLWNYVGHSDLPIDFGKWSWLLNSPAYHRRHHSTLREHYDSNFAGLFPIFDVLAGSYFRPTNHPPTGLDERPADLVDVLLWPLRYARRLESAPAQD